MYHHVPFPILEEIYPRELLEQVLNETGRWEQRERKLTHLFMVYVLIAWTILPLTALKQVCSQITSALRWLSRQPAAKLPGASALCYRRKTLGVSPLRLLMRHACQPLCQPKTPGAFLFDRRLISVDSKLFDVCDSQENDWTFRGRDQQDQPRTSSPFPQLRLLSALEIGSHAHLGAVLAPGYRSEMALVEHLLTFLPPHSLILQDSGFRGAWWLQRLVQHGHDTITRLQANDYPCKGPRLPDGSYLVTTYVSKDREPLILRIIEYRLSPELAGPLAQMQKSRSRSGRRVSKGADQVYRLATTLLDPVRFPALEIAACYHERWELELVYDEMQEHQMSTPQLLSKTSTGVMQEAWAMLLGHYALRAWMMQSASQGEVLDVDRLSFTQALCVLGTALTLSTPLLEVPTEQWKPRVLEDLRQKDRLLAPIRRLRSYPRVVKVASTRFFVKRAKDLPFILADTTKTWKDFVLPLSAPQDRPLALLI
jgi:transposase IS4-like protein/DDE family transposase